MIIAVTQVFVSGQVLQLPRSKSLLLYFTLRHDMMHIEGMLNVAIGFENTNPYTEDPESLRSKA